MHPSVAPRARRIKRCVACVAVALAFGGVCGAGEALPPNSADGLFRFANQLRDEGDYFRAITEYRRLLFHFPASPRADAARKAVGRCYVSAERWKEAEVWLGELQGIFAGKPLGQWATFEKASARFTAKSYEGAAAAFDEFLAEHPAAPRADEARWRRAWSYLLAYRFDRAEVAFAAIKPPSRYAAAARELATESRKLAGRRRKSPLLAGILGIVPGLGHFYCGRYRDGAVSLVFNGMLGWGAVSAFGHGAKAAGVVTTLFGSNFYLGSIFGGVNWAHRTNRARDDKQITRLRTKHGL